MYVVWSYYNSIDVIIYDATEYMCHIKDDAKYMNIFWNYDSVVIVVWQQEYVNDEWWC